MYASHQARDTQGVTALVHCTETDKCCEMQVVTLAAKQLVLYCPKTDNRVVLNRSDVRKPYVAQWRGVELTVLDADIE